jgi:hypothetical protein
VGETTPTDPRAQRNRASRRGGHLTTRARSPSHNTGLPTCFTPSAPVPDGRTVCRPTPHRKRSGPTRPATLDLSYRLTTLSKGSRSAQVQAQTNAWPKTASLGPVISTGHAFVQTCTADTANSAYTPIHDIDSGRSLLNSPAQSKQGVDSILLVVPPLTQQTPIFNATDPDFGRSHRASRAPTRCSSQRFMTAARWRYTHSG